MEKKQMKKAMIIALIFLIGMLLTSGIVSASFSVSANPSEIKAYLSANNSKTYVKMNFWNPSDTDSNYTIVLEDERLKDYIRYDCNDQWQNDSRDFWCQDKSYVVKAGTPKGSFVVNILFLKKTDYTADLNTNFLVVARPIFEGQQNGGASVSILPQIRVKVIIHQIGSVSVGVTISPATGLFNSTLDGTTIVFTTFNSGDKEIPITLSLSGTATRFSYFEPQGVTLKPNEYARFNVNVDPDQNVTEGETYTLNVVAKTLNGVFDIDAESNIKIFFNGARTKPYPENLTSSYQTIETKPISPNDSITGFFMGLKGNNSQLLIYVVTALVAIAVFAYLLGRRSAQKVSLLAICFLMTLFLISKFSLGDNFVVTANVTQGCGDKNCNLTQGENCTTCPEDCYSCPITSTYSPSGGGGQIYAPHTTNNTTRITKNTTTKITTNTTPQTTTTQNTAPQNTTPSSPSSNITPIPLNNQNAPVNAVVVPLGAWALILIPIIAITVYIFLRIRKFHLLKQ